MWPGVIKVYQPAAPAAGADLAYTVPTGKRWRVQAFSIRLVCTGVANRRVYFRALDTTGARLLWSARNAQTLQTDGQTHDYFWGVNGPTQSVLDNMQWVEMAPLVLTGGQRLITATGGIAVGDQFSNAILLVEEWDESGRTERV
jgi:hypothetical protein